MDIAQVISCLTSAIAAGVVVFERYKKDRRADKAEDAKQSQEVKEQDHELTKEERSDTIAEWRDLTKRMATDHRTEIDRLNTKMDRLEVAHREEIASYRKELGELRDLEKECQIKAAKLQTEVDQLKAWQSDVRKKTAQSDPPQTQ